MSRDSSQHPQGQDTRGHPCWAGSWPLTWGEGGKTPGVSMLGRRPSQSLWDTWDRGPCPYGAGAELPPMNSWQMKMLQGSVWIRREPSTDLGPAFPTAAAGTWGFLGRGPWAKSLFSVPGHVWVARSHSGQHQTRGKLQHCDTRKTSHRPFCVPLSQHFSVPPQTLPETSCPQMSCGSLLCYPGSQGGVVWGLGFVGVWVCWGFSVAKTSPSLNRVRDHPSKVAQSKRVPPRRDPNPCPTVLPLQLPGDEGGES